MIEVRYGYCACGCGEKTGIAKRTNTRNGHLKGEPFKYIHNHHGKGKSKQFCKNGHERTPDNLTPTKRCKICSDAYNEIYRKEYYINNSDRQRQNLKTWIENNPEKYKEQNRKRSRIFRKNNPEKHKFNMKRYYVLNSVKLKEYITFQRNLNPEKYKNYNRVYYKNNPEIFFTQASKRRAIKLNAFVANVNRIEIFKRDWHTCMICKKPLDMNAKWPDPFSPSIDHVIPLTKGGTHEPANVQAAHLRCNISKGNRI